MAKTPHITQRKAKRRKASIAFSEEKFNLLNEFAEAANKSLGQFIRDIIDERLFDTKAESIEETKKRLL